jgi:WD40 repeat protein
MVFSQDESDASSQGPPLPAESPQRRLSRRTLLKVAGVAGVGLGAGVAGREVYLLAQNHTVLTYRGHDAQINGVAWSPDSRWIASASDDEVQIWETLTGRLRYRFPYEMGYESVAWSPDGRYLAAGSWDGTVSVWQVVTGQQIGTYRGHVQEPAVPNISRAGLAEQAGQTMLRPSSLRILGIESVAWSPDSARLISSGSAKIRVWEALTGTTLLRFGSGQDAYRAGAWSSDGQHILMMSIQRGIERHLATTGALESTLSIGDDQVNGPSSWSPDGRWLATLSSTAAIGLWDATTGRQVLTFGNNSEEAIVVVWSPDSRRIASTGYDLTGHVRNAANGQTDYTYWGHMNPFQLFFQGGWLPGTTAADPARSSSNIASAASLLKSASALLPQDSGGSPQGILALAWAPNGRYIASGDSDNTVQVWQPG